MTRDWREEKGGGLLPWPASAQTLTVEHQGQGRPWVTLSSQAAIPLKTPLNAGYRITRELGLA